MKYGIIQSRNFTVDAKSQEEAVSKMTNKWGTVSSLDIENGIKLDSVNMIAYKQDEKNIDDNIILNDIDIKCLAEKDGKLLIGYLQKVLCKRVSSYAINFDKNIQDKMLNDIYIPLTYNDVYFIREIENSAKYNKNTNEITIKVKNN